MEIHTHGHMYTHTHIQTQQQTREHTHKDIHTGTCTDIHTWMHAQNTHIQTRMYTTRTDDTYKLLSKYQYTLIEQSTIGILIYHSAACDLHYALSKYYIAKLIILHPRCVHGSLAYIGCCVMELNLIYTASYSYIATEHNAIPKEMVFRQETQAPTYMMSVQY